MEQINGLAHVNLTLVDKHGLIHDHASLQRLTDKGYRLHFK